MAKPLLDKPGQVLFEARGGAQRNLDLGRRDRVASALVLEQQRECGDVQLLRREPTGQLQDQPARDKQQRLSVLDAVHQLDARVERRRHVEPVIGRRRSAGHLVEPVDQLRAATLFEAGAGQALQVRQRFAAELVEPRRVPPRIRGDHKRHARERAAQ
ncbi:hypothetical protein FEP72_03736 [Burkholderia multivorans]|nr:hypothetical protein [Burkholderia multivorans]